MHNVNFRKIGKVASEIVFTSSFESCQDYVKQHFPNFKECNDYGVPYFFNVIGKGVKGEISISPIKKD